MPGEIALVGGEEFRVRCEEMDREIMRASGGDPAKVLIIPTAAVTGPAKAANDGVVHFGNLGGDSSQLMVLDKSQADDDSFIRPVDDTEVVYFTGGSPDHLLETLRDSRLLTAILRAVERGAVLAGSSAGAMVMGSYMRRPRSGGWVEALGLAPNIVVLPHHENRNPTDVSRELLADAPSGLTFLGVDARTGCLGRPGSWRVVGSGKVTVYRGSEWGIYSAGKSLPGDV